MKALAHVIVAIAWCIPGRPHRWAKVLRAERKAGREAAQKFIQGAHDYEKRRRASTTTKADR